jgi:hypothetical protein
VIENFFWGGEGDLNRDAILNYIKKDDDVWINIYSDDQKLMLKQTVSNLEYLDVFIIYIKTKTDLTDRIIFDTDSNNDFYRLTSRSVKDNFGYNYLSIESTKDLRETLESKYDNSYLKDYVESVLGIDLDIDEICVKSGKLNLMTKAYVLDLEKNSDEVSNLLIENNVINLSHNGLNNSMNEQILAALWYIDGIKCEGMV